ncbi:MAG: hypothetical protein RR202_11880 [Bacteroidales bacterium]
MRDTFVFSILLFAFAISMPAKGQRNELKPLLDKSIFDIRPLDDQLLHQPLHEAVHPSFYLEKRFKEYEEYVKNGVELKPFMKVPLNLPSDSRQIYTFKTSSGQLVTVVNRYVPGFGEAFRSANMGVGTSVSFDFNLLVYYMTHPGARAQRKRTALKRVQITQYVYPD